MPKAVGLVSAGSERAFDGADGVQYVGGGARSHVPYAKISGPEIGMQTARDHDAFFAYSADERCVDAGRIIDGAQRMGSVISARRNEREIEGFPCRAKRSGSSAVHLDAPSDSIAQE